MRTKSITAIAVAAALAIAGTALALSMNTRTGIANQDAAPAAPTVIETDSCCLTGDCCCPGRGDCCDPAAKARAAASGVRYVKKAGPGCCVTGDCCCPGQGSCCAADAAKPEPKAGPTICPLTGEELACPNCCPLNKAQQK